MSHFTVMVIGNDPEAQLAPYDENLVVDEYEVGIVPDEEKQRMLDHYTEKGYVFDSFESCYKRFGDDWNHNAYHQDAEGIWREYSTYNPKSKWDWYSLGGRWSGALIRLKPDAKSGRQGHSSLVYGNQPGIDQALKKDIDFEKIRKERYNEAISRYREAAVKCGGSIPKLIHTWHDVLQMKGLTIEEKRAKYRSQESVQIWNKVNEHNPFFDDLDEYQCTEEEFGTRAALSSFTTYAYVINGEWYERGQMGWFGISIGDIPEEEWNQEVKTMLDALPDDTLISIYDCHI